MNDLGKLTLTIGAILLLTIWILLATVTNLPKWLDKRIYQVMFITGLIYLVLFVAVNERVFE